MSWKLPVARSGVSSTLCTYAHSINLAPPGTALKKNQLLGTLTDDEMKVFIDYAFPCSFDVGADIITQGDAGDFFYIIRSGTVEYFVDGKKQTYVGQKHDSFGELALLRDVPRAATTRAKTACDLFKISRDSFRYAIAAAAQENSNSAYDAIKSVKIFENLSDQQLKDVSKVCMAVNMRAKTTIFKKGDPGSIFYIIQSGSVMMSDIGENMTDVTLEAGQTFGEKALMTKEKRNATATTASETTLLEIDREDFEKILGPLADAISKSQNIRILEATELLKNLGADEKEQVISMFTEQAFKKGTKILDEGKADSTFYLVKEGEVSMSTRDAGQRGPSIYTALNRPASWSAALEWLAT